MTITIVRLTLAFALGIALVIGWFVAPAATFLLTAALLTAVVVADEGALLLTDWPRCAAFVLVGVVLGHNAIDARVHDCRNSLRDGSLYTVDAFLQEEQGKGSTPIELRAIGAVRCSGQLRMLAPFRSQALPAGAGIRVTGTWSRDAQAGPLAAGAGIFLAQEISADGTQARLPAARGRIVHTHSRAVRRRGTTC